MKNAILGIVIILSAWGCSSNIINENQTQLVNAEIMGLDNALCPCCGSWLIEIEGEDERLQFVSLPDDSEINLTTATFPLQVKLDYSKDEAHACPNYVLIDEIEVVE